MCAVKCCNTHSSGETVEETLRMSVCGLTSLTVRGGLTENTAHTGVSILGPTFVGFNNAVPKHFIFFCTHRSYLASGVEIR